MSSNPTRVKTGMITSVTLLCGIMVLLIVPNRGGQAHSISGYQPMVRSQLAATDSIHVDTVLPGVGGVIAQFQSDMLIVVGDRVMLARSEAGELTSIAQSDSIPLPITDIAACRDIVVVTHAEGVSVYKVSEKGFIFLQSIETRDIATSVSIDCDRSIIVIVGGVHFTSYTLIARIDADGHIVSVNDKTKFFGGSIEYYRNLWYLSTGGTFHGRKEIISFRAESTTEIVEMQRINVNSEPGEISILDKVMIVPVYNGVISLSLSESGIMTFEKLISIADVTNTSAQNEMIAFSDREYLYLSQGNIANYCHVYMGTINDIKVIGDRVLLSRDESVEELKVQNLGHGEECQMVIISKLTTIGRAVDASIVDDHVVVLSESRLILVGAEGDLPREMITLTGASARRRPLRLFHQGNRVVVTYDDDSIEIVSFSSIQPVSITDDVVCTAEDLGIQSSSMRDRFDVAIEDMVIRDDLILLAGGEQGVLAISVANGKCLASILDTPDELVFGALAISGSGRVYARTDETSALSGVAMLRDKPATAGGSIERWLEVDMSELESMQLEMCGDLGLTTGVSFVSAQSRESAKLYGDRGSPREYDEARHSAMPFRAAMLAPPPPGSDENLIVFGIDNDGTPRLIDGMVGKFDAGRASEISCNDMAISIGSSFGVHYRNHRAISFLIGNANTICCRQEAELPDLPLGVVTGLREDQMWIADGDAGLLRVTRADSNQQTVVPSTQTATASPVVATVPSPAHTPRSTATTCFFPMSWR